MKLRVLQKAYNNAVKSDKDKFDIDGYHFLTAYAKYLIEYLTKVKKLKGSDNVTFVQGG